VASKEAREQAIRAASEKVRSGPAWVRRAADAPCTCPRYGLELGYDEGCPVHGNEHQEADRD
jgi:hypothetical protein